MSVGIAERFDDPNEQLQSAMENALANTRCAMPGIIQSFDPQKQTASVQPALTEKIKIGNEEPHTENLPLLSDVPVQFPRAGGYCITLPVKAGDECLLIFGDMCIDGWWQSGGIQDQVERRRHDLSDAMALVGITSVPRVVPGYSPDTIQIRSDDGGTYIEIDKPNINILADTVTITGKLVVTEEATIHGIAFTPHQHSNVMPGGGLSGPPVGGG